MKRLRLRGTVLASAFVLSFLLVALGSSIASADPGLGTQDLASGLSRPSAFPEDPGIGYTDQLPEDPGIN